jgi:hypothetical protein
MTRLLGVLVATALLAGGAACSDGGEGATPTSRRRSTTSSSTAIVGPPAPEGVRTAVAQGIRAIEAHLDALRPANFHTAYRVEGVEGLDAFEVRWLAPTSRIDAIYKGVATQTYVDAGDGTAVVCSPGADGQPSCAPDGTPSRVPPIGVVDPATGLARIREALRTPRITTSSRMLFGIVADCARIPVPESDAVNELCLAPTGAVLYARSPTQTGAFVAEATSYVTNSVQRADVTAPPIR